jgi:hypothetical protein
MPPSAMARKEAQGSRRLRRAVAGALVYRPASDAILTQAADVRRTERASRFRQPRPRPSLPAGQGYAGSGWCGLRTTRRERPENRVRSGRRRTIQLFHLE